jgi:ABC-2 type transport system ATP-binding protein
MLIGLLRPSSGVVRTLGIDPSRDGLAVRGMVGYVPEALCLYDWMTVREIGWFASGFHSDYRLGGERYIGKFNAMAKEFSLDPKKKIRQLSKGMKAKVSLALALASDPELLILDEPTSGLDLMVRREFLESMVDLAGAGRTVFLSSHQIAEVERVASHVALMHEGKLLLAEPLDDLRERTFMVNLTFSRGDHPIGPIRGLPVEAIDIEDQPRQARWLVHAVDRSALEPIRMLPGVLEMTVASPSLEEIYVGYLRGRRTPGGGPPTSASAVA